MGWTVSPTRSGQPTSGGGSQGLQRGMARAVCQGAKTAKRYAALGAGMEVDAQGYGREPTAMVRGVLSCLFVCF